MLVTNIAYWDISSNFGLIIQTGKDDITAGGFWIYGKIPSNNTYLSALNPAIFVPIPLWTKHNTGVVAISDNHRFSPISQPWEISKPFTLFRKTFLLALWHDFYEFNRSLIGRDM